MRASPSIVLVFVTTFSIAALAAPDRIRIVSPPDRFFAASPVLSVNVAATLRADDRVLVLRVDGEERAKVRLEGRARDITHTFTLEIAVQDPPALIEVCIASRGKPGAGASCASVRAAGPMEWQRLRETLEELDALGRTIDDYMYFKVGTGPFPGSLDPLVPKFLPALPGAGPLGLPIEYVGGGDHFSLSTALPGAGEVRYGNGAFTSLPSGALTDREAARIIRSQIRDIAFALEGYRIDSTVYPETLDALIPTYARSLPTTDPYGHPYRVALTPLSYTLSSLGRDGAPGGSGFDADTVVTNVLKVLSTTPYVGDQEYARQAFFDLFNDQRAIEEYVANTGHLPATLRDAADPIDAGPQDLCGNPYVYRTFGIGSAEERYTLQAPGCDGVLETDAAETSVGGSNFSTCREIPLSRAFGRPNLFE